MSKEFRDFDFPEDKEIEHEFLPNSHGMNRDALDAFREEDGDFLDVDDDDNENFN